MLSIALLSSNYLIIISLFLSGQSLHTCENLLQQNDSKFVKLIETELQALKESQSQAFRNHNLKMGNEMTNLKKEFEDKLSGQKHAQIELEKMSQNDLEKLQFEIKSLEAKVEKSLGTKLMKDLHKIETKLDNYLQDQDEKLKSLEESVNSLDTKSKAKSKMVSKDFENLLRVQTRNFCIR